MESEDCLWSRKEQIQNRNVQAADMVVYVQNNLWSSLQSTLPPPGQIKFLWSLVADVYIFCPYHHGNGLHRVRYAEYVRHLYKPKNMSICGKYVSASGNAPRSSLKATPQAMPQAFSQNFRNFQNFSPRRRPRLRLRA
ncbi:hypothetical protein T4A_4618 [Trichinella pseudospiralis]|uniref:Uncharacterized protein n=1 Tax=Trichinella pseudospiralis TaxID=6337 RepID=A0A0V1EHR6_TRIPS|nr:hypothetical protein T4A_4618 [Trichinella pseudospiralis]